MKIVGDEEGVDRSPALQQRTWLFAINGRGYTVGVSTIIDVLRGFPFRFHNSGSMDGSLHPGSDVPPWKLRGRTYAMVFQKGTSTQLHNHRWRAHGVGRETP